MLEPRIGRKCVMTYLIEGDKCFHDILICGLDCILVCLDIESVKSLMLFIPPIKQFKLDSVISESHLTYGDEPYCSISISLIS